MSQLHYVFIYIYMYACDLVMCFGDFNGHVGGHMFGFDGDRGGYGVGQRNFVQRMLFEFCLAKKACMSKSWFKREEKRKVVFRQGENETEIMLIKKEHQQLIQDVKAILGVAQHASVVADMDAKKIKNLVRKACTERRKISLMKDLKIRK